MDKSLFDNLRDLQSLIRREGLGGTLVSFHDSKLASGDVDDPEIGEHRTGFAQLIVEEEIVSVCRDLFESGFFNQAVDEAFKALEVEIQRKSGVTNKGGEELARLVFTPDEPILTWSSRLRTSQCDEQAGYYHLFTGAFLGLSNPVRDEIGWVTEEDLALDAILLAQHLLRKIRKSGLAPPTPISVI